MQFSSSLLVPVKEWELIAIVHEADGIIKLYTQYLVKIERFLLISNLFLFFYFNNKAFFNTSMVATTTTIHIYFPVIIMDIIYLYFFI